jgi:hypothetical protein
MYLLHALKLPSSCMLDRPLQSTVPSYGIRNFIDKYLVRVLVGELALHRASSCTGEHRHTKADTHMPEWDSSIRAVEYNTLPKYHAIAVGGLNLCLLVLQSDRFSSAQLYGVCNMPGFKRTTRFLSFACCCCWCPSSSSYYYYYYYYYYRQHCSISYRPLHGR